VKKELKRGKPDFDGTLIPIVEAHEGVVPRPPSRRYRLEKSVSALPGTYSAACLRPPDLRAYAFSCPPCTSQERCGARSRPRPDRITGRINPRTREIHHEKAKRPSTSTKRSAALVDL
jgi:hypothetical protein